MNALDLVLLFLFALAIFNYSVQRSVLFPPFVFCAMWLLDLTVIRSGFIEVDPLHDNTLAIVAAGAASFSMGGWIASLVPRKLLRIHSCSPRSQEAHASLRNLLMILVLCCLPVMFYLILQLSRSVGGGFNLLAQARLALVNASQTGDSTQSYVLAYLTLFTSFTSLLFATEQKDRQFWAVTVVALSACILSTGRTNLLLLISGLSAIRLLQTKQESLFDALRLLRWPLILFVGLYLGLIFTNKNTEGMTGGVVGIAMYFLLGYIVGPLAAFDRIVQHPTDFTAAAGNFFEYPLKLAAFLHLTDHPPLPVQSYFVFVPFPANVYTIFKLYFLELGITGTMAILFLIGLFHSLLYIKARQGGKFSVYLFAFSVYSILMVIFDEAAYTLGGYVRAGVFGLLYFLVGSVRLSLLPRIKRTSRSESSSRTSVGI